jgi:hypothetical protein
MKNLWIASVLMLAGCNSFSPDAGHEVVTPVYNLGK